MPSKNIAFFGATGGCTFATLCRSLQAGHHCRVLARNPAKLVNMLKARNLDIDTSKTLQIVQGDVTDVVDVKRTLDFEVGEDADIVVCGIGGLPRFQFSLSHPLTIEDPRICYKGTTAILSALSTFRTARSQSQSQKQTRPPLLIVVSSAGVATSYREYPLLMTPLYRWLLNTMLEDKRHVHDAVLAAASPVSGKGAEQTPLVRFVSVRPSHLVDGEGRGSGGVRAGVGVVRGKSEVMGWQVAREDVGAWMFEKLCQGEVEEGLVNRCVVVTW